MRDPRTLLPRCSLGPAMPGAPPCSSCVAASRSRRCCGSMPAASFAFIANRPASKCDISALRTRAQPSAVRPQQDSIHLSAVPRQEHFRAQANSEPSHSWASPISGQVTCHAARKARRQRAAQAARARRLRVPARQRNLPRRVARKPGRRGLAGVAARAAQRGRVRNHHLPGAQLPDRTTGSHLTAEASRLPMLPQCYEIVRQSPARGLACPLGVLGRKHAWRPCAWIARGADLMRVPRFLTY